jgi:hypothetical protein
MIYAGNKDFRIFKGLFCFFKFHSTYDELQSAGLVQSFEFAFELDGKL